MNRRKLIILVISTLVIIAGVIALFRTQLIGQSNKGQVQVVAAENFWGSLVSQIGGSKVHVTSIVSDPNADPHEYESNAQDAEAIDKANYIILNGAGYDSWANKLISADGNNSQNTLTVATLLGKKDGDNPHFWYNPTYVNQVVSRMESDLIKIDPGDKSYFQSQYNKLQISLSGYQDQINNIKQNFAGTKVAATEDIFDYLASAADLDLISPPAFTQAVAEGNDPPANSIAEFQQQLQNGQVKILVYNQQTVTPLTTNMKLIAAQHNIPIVGITETIQPPNLSFQDWMNSELIQIENSLNANALGQ